MPISMIRLKAIVSSAALSRIALMTIAMLPLAATPAVMASDDLPRAKPEEVGVSTERLHRIDEVIQRHIDNRHIAGAVTLVARKGRVVHFEGKGSRTSSRSSR